MKNLSSELFRESYCIFIEKNCVKDYKPMVEKYKNKGIRILEGDFENPPVCVVIPNSLNFKEIERELFETKQPKSGFWGQYGIGYKNKTWKEI